MIKRILITVATTAVLNTTALFSMSITDTNTTTLSPYCYNGISNAMHSVKKDISYYEEAIEDGVEILIYCKANNYTDAKGLYLLYSAIAIMERALYVHNNK